MSERSSPVEHIRTIGLSLGPALVIGAIAWGAATTKVDANAVSIGKLWGQARELGARMTQAEQVNAKLLQHMEDQQRWEDRVDAKLDRLAEGRR